MRKGFALRELLAVIIVLSVIVVLIVAMIGRARENARRMRCRDNLKQLVLASHNFFDANKVLPKANYQPLFCTEKYFNDETGTYGNRELYGILPVLMPYIESNPYYDALWGELQNEGDAPTPWDESWLTQSPPRSEKFPDAKALGAAQFSAFLCPDDPMARNRGEGDFGRTSYHGCRGDIWGDWLSPSTRGVFVSGPNKPIGLGDIIDGTSNTMMFAECVIGNNRGRKDAPIQGGLAYGMPYGPDAVPMRCLERAGKNGKLTGEQNHDVLTDSKGPGLCWMSGLQVHDQFFAILPPNSPSCSSESDWQNWAMISASSYHPGGCNVACADGSVLFVGDDVDCGDLNQTALDFKKYYAEFESAAEIKGGQSPWGVWGSVGCRNTGGRGLP